MQKKIGFIGTGVMGKSMAEHLLNAGYKLHIFTRTKAKAIDLIENGATWENFSADVTKNSDIIITMIGTPQDVQNVYFGKQGVINNAKSHSYLIDMTTSKPSLAREIFTKANSKDI